MKHPTEHTDEELRRHYNQCSHNIWVDFRSFPCPLCVEYEKKLSEDHLPCVCEGNWRQIIKESEPLMGKRFIDDQSNQWIFDGVLWAEEDFYYLFSNMSGIHRYITCCVSLKQSGMRLI